MNSPILELHYYLSDGSHSMNAVTRNKCESELLGLLIEAADVLGILVELESQAYREGGLREFWRFLGNNSDQLLLVVTIIALIFSRIPVDDPQENALEQELTRLEIEEKKLRIKKLRRELGEDSPTVDVVDEAVSVLSENPKVVVRRSNFYKNLAGYAKVESIGITALQPDLQPLHKERLVSRSDFRKFILRTHRISPRVIPDAVIEIVSPVLKEGNYKWKGVFNGEILSFNMNDVEFKDMVLGEDVAFKHGTFIECVLNEHRKLDEVGDIVITGYTVSTVIRKFDDEGSLRTRQGIEYLHAKRLMDGQAEMFVD